MLVRRFVSIALTLTGGGFWWAPATATPTQFAQYRHSLETGFLKRGVSY